MEKLCTKWFKKWAKRAKLTDSSLLSAIKNLESGLSVVNLGGQLYKLRINRPQGGKSSGFRTILVYKENDRAIFLYGFGKNEKENIDKTELQYFKKLAKDLISLNSSQLKDSIEQQILFDLEVTK